MQMLMWLQRLGTERFLCRWISNSKYKRGQALLELAIWSVLLIMGATVIASYTLTSLYQQRVMLKNYRMVKGFLERNAFLRDGGNVVYHTLIEHHPIPVLNNFLPEIRYQVFVSQINLTWSRALFVNSKNSNKTYAYDVWRVIIDGENLAEKMNILELRRAAGKVKPGDPLTNRGDIFIIDAVASYIVNPYKDPIINALNDTINALGNSDLRNKVTTLKNNIDSWFNETKNIFDDPKLADALTSTSPSVVKLRNYRDTANSLLSQIKNLPSNSITNTKAKNSMQTAVDKINALYNTVVNKGWQMDLDMSIDGFTIPNASDDEKSTAVYKLLPKIIGKHIRYLKQDGKSRLEITREVETGEVSFQTNYTTKKVKVVVPNKEVWKW